MKRPTTTQKSIFFVLEFIRISLWMARSQTARKLPTVSDVTTGAFLLTTV
jgi:hypothetical protein